MTMDHPDDAARRILSQFSDAISMLWDGAFSQLSMYQHPNHEAHEVLADILEEYAKRMREIYKDQPEGRGPPRLRLVWDDGEAPPAGHELE